MHFQSRRRLRHALGVVLGAALTAGLTPIGPVAGAAARQTAQGSADASSVSIEARREAAKTGRPVELLEARDAYSTTVVNPDGTFTLTQSTTPQRVRADDGSWHPIDTTLERRADGTIGPKAAVVDLSFSSGGPDGPLLRLAEQGGALELDWSDALPGPRLDGDTATYPELFEGVDLKLTATAEGYRQVLVVKSARAAANPRLQQIRFGVRTDGLDLVPGAAGGLRALDADGRPVFRGPAGLMWDSAGSPTAGPRASTPLPANKLAQVPRQNRSASQTQGDADRAGAPHTEFARPTKGDSTEILPVRVEPGALSVRPVSDLLHGPETVYPVYIDPTLGVGASERTVLSSDGDKFYAFDDDLGVGRCGNADGYYCGSGYVNRMYFEFGAGRLANKQVLDATFRAYETWSFNCTPHWVDLVRTDNISEGTRWPGPAHRDHLGDRYVSNGRGSACSPEQPDSWVEFNDNPAEPDENLTDAARALADGRFSRLTLMLRAKDEGDTRAWKRFKPNAELQVQYVTKPGVPTNVGVIPGEGETAYCSTSASNPTVVTRADPTATARVQAASQPVGTEYRGALRAYLYAERKDPTSGDWIRSWESTAPSTGYHVDGTLEKVRMSPRHDGLLHRMRARTQSHWTYDAVTSSSVSAYSSWCYFLIDSTAPKAPVITSSAYPRCTADDCPSSGSPGEPGNFTFKPNAADKDISGYRWRLEGSGEPAEVVAGSTVSVPISPPLGGTLTLTVEARDVHKRFGTPSDYTFKVGLPSGPVGHWHFAEAPGTKAAPDTGTGGTARQPALIHTVAGTKAADFSLQGRRGIGDGSLYLNRGSVHPEQRTGYADTEGMPVNTRDSFTVSTWVRLNDADSTQVVLAAPGDNLGAALTLYYSAGDRKWVLNRSNHDGTEGVVAIRSLAEDTAPPTQVWTHLTAVYNTRCVSGTCSGDHADDTLQLFVNGRPQGSAVELASVSPTYRPWTANSGFQFGRSRVNGSYGGYLRGRIDEVKVWQRALTQAEIRREGELLEADLPGAELAARWDFEEAAAGDTRVPDTSGYSADAMNLSDEGAAISVDSGVKFNGVKGHARADGPVVDETGSFTVTASVRLDSAALKNKPVGYQARVLGQATPSGDQSSWSLWATKVSDDGPRGQYVWHFGRTAVDSSGKVRQAASLTSSDFAALDEWVQITGVYDAARPQDGKYGEIRFYVEGNEAGNGTPAFSLPFRTTTTVTAGRGSLLGSVGNYLAGCLAEVRIWSGAMTFEQVRSRVNGMG
ncbi:LamG domain-containing protein [Streptomyces sp. NPDC006879]|uniref:LamG domain-containing protein n=1 Tax=Streptomyces sp. NPDC006879 TaxID=3364767 RepID=UPI00368C25FA